MATIAEQLQQLNDIKSAIKTAISNRGVAVADTDTFRSYADKIGEIGETVNKTKLGASIDTWIGDVDENGVLQKPTAQTALNFTGVTEIGSNALQFAFYRRGEDITSVDLSSLITVGIYGLYYAFSSCTGITGVLDLSSLRSVDNNGMYYAFDYCSGITSVDLSSLQSVGYYSMFCAFSGCKGITTISFPSLTSVQTNSLQNAFQSCTALTEIHFRADMQATIGTLTGYSSKFGATNADIIFDLIGTITVNGVAYSRSEPDSIHVDGVKTFVGWKDSDGNIVYTDATVKPEVDTVVYSDQGTTQVGTVESVA